MELNLARIHEAIAAAVPDRECLVFRDRRLTWAEIGERTRRFASVLGDAGLGAPRSFASTAPWESAHDHVALLLHNGNEYLEAMVGAFKARCGPVNVNYRYTATELAYVLGDSNSRAIVYHARFAPAVREVMSSLPSLRLLIQVPDESANPLLDGAGDYETALRTADATLAGDLVDAWSPDDLYICYTGGTTGMPKGVLWRQADFLVAALGIRRRNGEDFESIDEIAEAARTSTLRALPAPPLMHGAAHWNAISCWVAGGTVIIQDEPGRLDAHDILRTAARERATSLLIVGDPFARPIVDELDRGDHDLSSLRHVLSGGAVLSPHMKQRLLDHLGTVSIVDVLGSSESGRQGVSNRRAGEGGDTRFEPSPTAVVLDDSLHRRLGPGEGIGWLAQSGRVPVGYLGDRDKTERAFPVLDGVRLAVAGDRARIAEDGTIELLGRESVCINTGGEKVFAEEVETALKRHPSVYDAVVCGRPSPRWGSEVVAVVSPTPGTPLDTGALVESCRDVLAAFKLPKSVVVVEQVRRSPSGKADYRWAEQTAADRLGPDPPVEQP